MALAAVIFDLDGVLVDSEQVWGTVREELTRELGGRWHPGALRAMMGMSSLEWSRYMHDELGVRLPPAEISREVVRRVGEHYSRHLPLIDGAVDAVQRVAARWPLALASSANREIIDTVLELTGLKGSFAATVSSEEVPRGKPAPDVYLEAARRLGVDPAAAAAVEDSTNGLLSAKAAGMTVVAIPNREFPPAPEGLAAADVVIDSLHDLTPEAVELVAA
ncbi:MAG TPA: HAD family phosphatase [Thermoleophilaceae bacterium]|nr:HAD family phosphatase [Thermoleophilaceae bacterium]